jgi:hypothetical protein
MYQRVVLSVLIFIGLTLNQTVNADITGKVSAQAGGAIQGATVTLATSGATATTGADGMYTLTTTDVKSPQALQPRNTDITLQKGFLNFSLPEAAPVKYEIFDVKGSLLKKEVLKNAQKGIYRLNIAENTRSMTLLVIKASIGKKEKTFNYLPLNSDNAVHAQNRFSTPVRGGVSKITAVADFMKFTANGYRAQTIAITSYDTVVNVTMVPVENNCGEFTLKSNKLSTAIPTVGIIEWSYSKDVTSAHIEFGPQGSATVMKAPVDLKEPNYRTLLLGMKQQKSYVFRIVVNTGADTCVSDDYNLTTGTLSNAPKITKSGSGTSSMTGGFIVTTTGNGWGTGGGGTPMAVIFDLDGDVVWAASAPKGTGRNHMSWDGKDMWVNNANVGNANPSTAGEMRCISMDGLNVQNKVNGLSGAHHDFTVTPKNEVVTIAYTSSGSSSQILARAANGTISTLVADVSTLYKPSGDCHPNYIQYYPSDDCFIISDRNPNLFVKFKRDGTLVWQFGGSSPKGKSFSVSVSWQVNHGFELEADGRFVFFNNGSGGGSSKIQEFVLNESTMSATKSWEKNTNGSSMSLGNVQRVPNDHYLVTVSNAGKMEEFDNARNVVRTFSTGEFGYSEFRMSLYGPPVDY